MAVVPTGMAGPWGSPALPTTVPDTSQLDSGGQSPARPETWGVAWALVAAAGQPSQPETMGPGMMTVAGSLCLSKAE